MAKQVYIDHNKSDFMNMNTDEKIMWRTGQFEIPGGLSKDEAFDELMRKIADHDTDNLADYGKEVNKPVISVSRRFYFTAFAAAATVIMLLGIWLLWFHNPVENVIADKGNQTDYRLPDGTMISLNADSKISYNKKKFNKKRDLTLEGEAFFNVIKGSPFTISTNKADIRILGTSFNVFSRENIFRVSCFTGKISVSSGSKSVIITQNETAYLEDNMLVVRQEGNINSTAVWRAGEFTYENASLKLVLDEMERQFNVTFVLPDISGKNYTGGFTNKNLVEALDLICIPMDLTYEIKSNGKILIQNNSR